MRELENKVCRRERSVWTGKDGHRPVPVARGVARPGAAEWAFAAEVLGFAALLCISILYNLEVKM